MPICYCAMFRDYTDHIWDGLELTAGHGGDCLRQLINAFVPSMYPDISPSQGGARSGPARAD